MGIIEKGQLIGLIIGTMRLYAETLGKPFDGGDLFLSLAFKSDDELNNLAKLLGV